MLQLQLRTIAQLNVRLYHGCGFKARLPLFFMRDGLGRDSKEIHAPHILRLERSLTNRIFGQNQGECDG
jgi:hypothetical protein